MVALDEPGELPGGEAVEIGDRNADLSRRLEYLRPAG